MVVDGRTYYWCPHHVAKDGSYNGLYDTHKPEDHDEVMKRRRKKTTKP